MKRPLDIAMIYILTFLIGCGGDSSTGADPTPEQTTGTLQMITTTSGSDKDADGYDLTVDGSNSTSADTSDSVYVSGLQEGSHEARLSGIADNCELNGNNPRSVSITADDTTSTTFDVSCLAMAKNKISYARNYDIFLMNADGSNPQRVTNIDGYKGRSAISHDGTKIAFIRDDDEGFSLYVMDIDGTNIQRLTSAGELFEFISWSPDDSQIAFNDSRGSGPKIYIINVDGTGETKLTDDSVNEYGPSWSPDGEKIAYYSDIDGDDEIYIKNIDGTGVRQVTNNISNESDPVWSPDGSKIAYQSYKDGNEEIYIMNSDGTGIRRITNHPDRDERATWSPDGSQVAFESDRDGDNDIYKINADGTGALTNLTASSVGELFPHWSPVK